MATATKIYEIADGVAITSKGVVLNEGQEVTAENFASETVFNELVKAKKIVEVTSVKKEEKKDESPTSSTGAAEPTAEGTTPKKNEKADKKDAK